jgi:hypothetical protein
VTRDVTAVCSKLFDDASMFPPEGVPTAVALQRHLQHRRARYSDAVGALVCLAGRLRQLDVAAERAGVGVLEVSAVVSDGLSAVPRVHALTRRLRRVVVSSVEVALAGHQLHEARRLLDPMLDAGVRCYLEIDAARLTETFVHELTRARLQLKLRLGATLIDGFCSEREVAETMVRCAAEPLLIKCSSGMHLAVRHRDLETAFEHHGYLNLALAARAAGATGNVQTVVEILRERRGRDLAERIVDLTASDTQAIRSVLGSVSTSNITESVQDLVELGLLSRAG